MSWGTGIFHALTHNLSGILKGLSKTQSDYLEKVGAKEIGDIVKGHAFAAAAAGLGVSWLPGAGSAVALAATVGIIWSMYFRINSKLGIKLSKTKLKSLASAMLTNIAASAITFLGGTVISIALSFVPGVGSVLASVIMGGLDYAVVFVSGIIYMKLLTKLFKAGKNIETLNEEELKAEAKATVNDEDVNSMFKEARKEYVRARKSGEATGKEHVDVVEDDEESLSVNCPNCGTEIHGESKFCNECGTSLIIICSSCNSANTIGLEYCKECGNIL